MLDSEFNGFASLFDSLGEYYQQREPLSPLALKMYFSALADYELTQIESAVMAHLKSQNGQFFPKVADIIRQIDGGGISADYIVAAAKLSQTPLGVLARIHIGCWDLNNQDGFYLRQRAEECLQLLPDWRERAKLGQYSDHEISTMLKYEVDPIAPFALGVCGPAKQDLLAQRINKVAGSARHQLTLEKPYKPLEESQEKNNITNFVKTAMSKGVK